MASTATAAALARFGAGLTLGNLVVPRLADRALIPTATAMLVLSAVSLALFAGGRGGMLTVIADVVGKGFWASTGYVGCALALAGPNVWVIAIRDASRQSGRVFETNKWPKQRSRKAGVKAGFQFI